MALRVARADAESVTPANVAVTPPAASESPDMALGTTFDPAVLQRLGTIGAAADLARARKWYERAAELGSSTASQQLAGLAEAR